jgi:hypothetical protein
LKCSRENIALNWERKGRTGDYGQANENIHQNKIGWSGGLVVEEHKYKSRKVVSKKCLGIKRGKKDKQNEELMYIQKEGAGAGSAEKKRLEKLCRGFEKESFSCLFLRILTSPPPKVVSSSLNFRLSP